MTFQRSASALHSIHLFCKVDIVVYCEGGPSLSVQDAFTATSNQHRTLDTVYWSRVIDELKLGKKVHCKSIGSKATLLAIARMLAVQQCNTVTICMDADYDVFLTLIEHNERVCYTYGYSWESDVINEKAVENVLRTLIGTPPTNITEELRDNIAQYKNTLVKWCEIDIALRLKSKPCVLDRDKPHSIVDHTKPWPEVNLARLRNRLRECGYARKPKISHKIDHDKVMRVAFGQSISSLMYHLVVSIAKKIIPNLRLDYESFMRVAIAETFSLLARGGLRDLAEHIETRRSAFS
jgi:hypothetical protein